MDIVLAAAHRLEHNSSSGNMLHDFSVPCANELIDELIFQLKDVVHLDIVDVNLGYAEGKLAL